MSSQPKSYLTPEEYLAIERQSETKHEYFSGEVFAMVGASRKQQSGNCHCQDDTSSAHFPPYSWSVLHCRSCSKT